MTQTSPDEQPPDGPEESWPLTPATIGHLLAIAEFLDVVHDPRGRAVLEASGILSADTVQHMAAGIREIAGMFPDYIRVDGPPGGATTPELADVELALMGSGESVDSPVDRLGAPPLLELAEIDPVQARAYAGYWLVAMKYIAARHATLVAQWSFEPDDDGRVDAERLAEAATAAAVETEARAHTLGFLEPSPLPRHAPLDTRWFAAVESLTPSDAEPPLAEPAVEADGLEETRAVGPDPDGLTPPGRERDPGEGPDAPGRWDNPPGRSF